MRQAGRKDPPVPGPAAGWGLPTCARCSIKLRPLPSRQFLCPRSQRVPPVTGEQPPQSPDWHRDPPGMTPMAFTTLLLVLALGAGEGQGPVGPHAGTRASGEVAGQVDRRGGPLGFLSWDRGIRELVAHRWQGHCRLVWCRMPG